MEKSVKFSVKKVLTGFKCKFLKSPFLLDIEKIKNVLHEKNVQNLPVSTCEHVSSFRKNKSAHVSAHTKRSKTREQSKSLIYRYIYNILLACSHCSRVIVLRVYRTKRGEEEGEKVTYMEKKGVSGVSSRVN